MNRIKIDVPSDHGADFRFHFTPKQLVKFRHNIIKGREQEINSIIDGKHFNFSSSGISYFKNKSFKGPNYGIPLDGLVDLIDKAMNDYHGSI